MRAQVASPMLSALFCIPVDFVLVLVKFIKLLRYFLPIFYLSIPIQTVVDSFLHYRRKDGGLFFSPVMGRECDFFDAEPLEHAGLGVDSWNEWWDEGPVCKCLL